VFNGKLSIPLASPAPAVFLIPSGAQFAVPWVYPPMDRLYTHLMVPRYARRAGAIITHTERGRQDIVRYTGAAADRVHVIPPGIEPRLRPVPATDIEKFRSRLGLPRPYVLFVGGITPLKNIRTLLRAFALVRRENDVDLVLAGFRRWRFDADIRLIEELGLTDRVRQTGFLPDDDLPALYSGAECLVMPSWYEGFGIPVVEAMACGTPVVSSTGGCLPEVTAGCAVMVDPASHEMMAAAIHQVLHDRALRSDLIARGLRHASQFTWERMTRSISSLLRSVAMARRR
jgi:glycosyltransferase involved in cell wall biosynthesis